MGISELVKKHKRIFSKIYIENLNGSRKILRQPLEFFYNIWYNDKYSLHMSFGRKYG